MNRLSAMRLCLVKPACTSLSCLISRMCFSIFDFNIPMNSLYVAFVNAIGLRSLTVGLFFFGISTVFDSVQVLGNLSFLSKMLFIPCVNSFIK